MREKTRKLILSIFLAACIVALMAASLSYTLTNGRYTGGELSEDSPYEDIIDFVGATAYEVSSPEELVNAIKNGYSYIEIADGAEEPFVVNSDIADVEVNLVLDVNGHIVVRNSRNPLINVQKSVSVVLVYDSSQAATGGFYNPVGSALQTSGGTLTVGAGIYESGPDADSQTDTDTYTTGTGVTLFNRGEDRTAAYPAAGTSATDLPILQGRAVGTDEFVYDYYFKEKPSNVNALIEADTYLIYTEESNCRVQDGQLYVNCTAGTADSGTRFSVESNVASCDFYYYYEKSTDGTGDDKTTTYAVIYGYHDVKRLARKEDSAAETLQEKGLVWPYAAIRSEAGNTFARGGTFQTYFGEENTYCIYSEGGTMTVGGSATPAFSALQSGVCIKMEEGQEDAAELRSAPSLTIDSGTFSSEIGDTIKMFGGTMTVESGTFTKTGCKKDTENDQIDNQTAIISLQGGTLDVNGMKSGSDVAPVYSVTMTAGGDANGGTLENVFGIRAVGGGKITTEGVSFDIYGDYSAGVLSYDGTINLGSDTLINVEQSDNTTVLTSAGVSSEASGTQQDHPVNLDGNVTINSNGLGITARGVVNVTGEGVAVTTTRGTGIYVNKGEFNVETGASITVKSTVLSGYSWATPPKSGTTDAPNNEPNIYNGVYVQGGSLVAEGTLNVEFVGVANDKDQKDENNAALNGKNAYRLFEIKSYAVRVEAASGGDTEVTIASGSITNSVGGGVYVGGGTVELGDETTKAGPTVKTTGTEIYNDENNDDMNAGPGGNWIYYLPKTGGPAVKVTKSDTASSSLYVYGGTYTSQQGDGIVTVGGTSYIYSGTFIGRDFNVDSGDRAGPGASYSFKVYGGEANVYGGTFGGKENDTYINSSGAFVMGTSAGAMGTANIYGGTFVVSNGNTGGQAGFSVYEFGKVLVDPGKGGEGQNLGGEVKMTGLAAGVAIEGNTSNAASVEIKGGTFSNTRNFGNSDGIWYGNANATLTISGGTFTGAVRSGLYFEVAPNGSNVQLSGGTFTGNSAINAESGLRRSISTNSIFADSAYCYTDVLQNSGNDTERSSKAICNREIGWFVYNYYQVGGSGTSSNIRLNDTTWFDGGNNAPLYERTKIVVYSNLGQVTYEGSL